MYQILILTPIEKIFSNPVLVPTITDMRVNAGIHCIMYTIQYTVLGIWRQISLSDFYSALSLSNLSGSFARLLPSY